MCAGGEAGKGKIHKIIFKNSLSNKSYFSDAW